MLEYDWLLDRAAGETLDAVYVESLQATLSMSRLFMSALLAPTCTCTYANRNMSAYLIKLRVEGLFYHRRFVLGFLLNVWLEVPEAGKTSR